MKNQNNVLDKDKGRFRLSLAERFRFHERDGNCCILELKAWLRIDDLWLG